MSTAPIEGIEERPGGAEALAVFEQVAAERALEDLADWQERRASWPPGWRRHAGIGLSTLYLTEDEFNGLMEAFDRLLAPYLEQRPIDDVASRPVGSKAIKMSLIAAPQEPTAAEAGRKKPRATESRAPAKDPVGDPGPTENPSTGPIPDPGASS